MPRPLRFGSGSCRLWRNAGGRAAAGARFSAASRSGGRQGGLVDGRALRAFGWWPTPKTRSISKGQPSDWNLSMKIARTNHGAPARRSSCGLEGRCGRGRRLILAHNRTMPTRSRIRRKGTLAIRRRRNCDNCGGRRSSLYGLPTALSQLEKQAAVRGAKSAPFEFARLFIPSRIVFKFERGLHVRAFTRTRERYFFGTRRSCISCRFQVYAFAGFR
jgi:hypothetical protein